MGAFTNTTLISGGYTSLALLRPPGGGWFRLMSQAIQVSLSKTPMLSQAAIRHGDSVNGIRREKGLFVQDVPLVEATLAFEPCEELLREIVAGLLGERRDGRWEIRVLDRERSLDWTFGECYAKSLSFSAQQSANLSVSMTFFIRERNVSLGWEEMGELWRGEENSSDMPLRGEVSVWKPPIPYYRWQLVREDGSAESDVTGFEFAFQQSVAPKYECGGSSEKVAPLSEYVLFGLPQTTFSYTTMTVRGGDIDFAARALSTQSKPVTEFGSIPAEREYRLVLNAADTRDGGYPVAGQGLLRISGVCETQATPEFSGWRTIQRQTAVIGTAKAIQ